MVVPTKRKPRFTRSRETWSLSGVREGAALQREERPRVAHGGLDLQAVAHDAGIAPQGGAAACIEARHLARLEVGERAAVAGALAQDGRPGQSRLRTLEGQHLEEQSIVIHRPSPFLIVIADIVGVGAARPPAAALAGVAGAGGGRGPGFVGHRSLSRSADSWPECSEDTDASRSLPKSSTVRPVDRAQ